MSPEAAALAERLRAHWDERTAVAASAPLPPAEALELLRRTGFPLMRTTVDRRSA